MNLKLRCGLVWPLGIFSQTNLAPELNGCGFLATQPECNEWFFKQFSANFKVGIVLLVITEENFLQRLIYPENLLLFLVIWLLLRMVVVIGNR